MFGKDTTSFLIASIMLPMAFNPGIGYGNSGDDFLQDTGVEIGIDEGGFDGWDVVPEVELARNSGGTQIDIGDIGLNLASNSATLNGNSVDGNVETGQIKNNALNDVSGINSLMFNTGNNVNFQSNMQINIFLK